MNKKFLNKKVWIVIAFAFFLIWRYEHNASKNDVAAASSQSIVLGTDDLASVKKENFSIRVPISGELYPLNQTTLIAKVGAEVQAVYVREGEAIKSKQLLAELNTADLRQTVKDKRAALSAAEASYQFSMAAEKRYKQLLDKHYYSQNDYDAAVNQVSVNNATVKQNTAALNEAELQLSYTRIVSSLDGIVSERDVEPGMNVSVGQTLFKVVNLDKLEWRALVPADEISHIQINQTATFEVDGLHQSFSGIVVRINPSAVAGTRSYYAYITVDNPKHLLKNGMFAQGGIALSDKNDALIIPFEAIRHSSTGGETYVYKIDAQQHIQKQKITLGLVDALNNKAEVISGLSVGEWVIASSAEVQVGRPVIFPTSLKPLG